MKIIAAILFVALMGAGLASGDEKAGVPKMEVPRGEKICNNEGTLCVVNKAGLDAIGDEMQVHYNTSLLMQRVAAQQATQIEYLKAELAKLQAIKGCAKVEVLPRGGKN